MPISPMAGSSPPNSDSERDPYRGVILLLLAVSGLATAGALAAGLWLPNAMLLDVGISLGIATGVLIGVAYCQVQRAMPSESEEEISLPPTEEETSAKTSAEVSPLPAASSAKPIYRRLEVPEWVGRWFEELGGLRRLIVGLFSAILIAIASSSLLSLQDLSLAPRPAVIMAAACLLAAGLAALAARYLSNLEPGQLPESPGLCRGARVVAWTLVVAAVSMGFAAAGMYLTVKVMQVAILIVDTVVCYDLVVAMRPEEGTLMAFPLDFTVLSFLGSRPNILASVLDNAEEQLGIDLRSTWALTVVRRSIEPLIIGLFLLGWISTSLTVVGVEEQGLVERWGVAVGGQPLMPGLHLHWPWPVDQVIRIPLQRVNSVQVGHETEEAEGPEDVLWAVEHAPNEFTLLLGNGRDLITIDAAVQYRIGDPRAWRYNSQNPADALRAIAYRAVMRSTVNHTLSEALSESIVTLTSGIRTMVQKDSNALGLGVDIIGFTLGGMHPPVPVAAAYEAVISAQIRKVTAVVEAQTYRTFTVPSAETVVAAAENMVRAQDASDLGLAAGEAWSFRTLESQYRAAPEDYFFRRRLETIEAGLAGRHFTILDSRFQRDGGELWLTQ